jgi:hypothetical protein
MQVLGLIIGWITLSPQTHWMQQHHHSSGHGLTPEFQLKGLPEGGGD